MVRVAELTCGQTFPNAVVFLVGSGQHHMLWASLGEQDFGERFESVGFQVLDDFDHSRRQGRAEGTVKKSPGYSPFTTDRKLRSLTQSRGALRLKRAARR